MANRNKMTGFSAAIENGDVVLVASGQVSTPIGERRNLFYNVTIYTQTPFCAVRFWDQCKMYHLVAEVTENRLGEHFILSTRTLEAETPEELGLFAEMLRAEGRFGGGVYNSHAWVAVEREAA